MNISDEAVDAAIEALLGSKLGDHAGINGEEFVEAAHLALEAAAPHLMAAGWDACADHVEEWYPAPYGDALKSQNPYRES